MKIKVVISRFVPTNMNFGVKAVIKVIETTLADYQNNTDNLYETIDMYRRQSIMPTQVDLFENPDLFQPELLTEQSK